MFFEYFENLRSKPKDVRKRYALGLSSALTFFVVLIWLTSIFLGSFGARGTKKEATHTVQEPETTSTMFGKANSFIDDTKGSGDFMDEEWAEELQNLNNSTQQTQNATVTPNTLSR
jgi:hypothetical protein